MRKGNFFVARGVTLMNCNYLSKILWQRFFVNKKLCIKTKYFIRNVDNGDFVSFVKINLVKKKKKVLRCTFIYNVIFQGKNLRDKLHQVNTHHTQTHICGCFNYYFNINFIFVCRN